MNSTGRDILFGVVIGAVLTLVPLLLAERYRRDTAPAPARRAYCLEALGERATVYIAGPSVAIVAWDPAEPGRYVVSEGRCDP